MNLRDLKYLVALVDHRHFGKAAEASFVSQPALSMQIKKLEETLGIPLLERTNKSVFLTETGAQIAERARAILHQVEEVKEMAKLAKDPYSSELKIGIIPTLAPYLLPRIMPLLAKRFPNVAIFLIEEQTALLMDKLDNAKIDAAFLALPVTKNNVKTQLLLKEEFMLAVPNDHELAQRKFIKPRDLKNQTLLLLSDGHCMRESTLAFCHQMQAAEWHDFRATSLETLRHMVAAGVGMTLMPKMACHARDRIAYVPFVAPKPERNIGMVWRTSTVKQTLIQDMADHLQKISI